ncbi:MAG: serine/threonine protein kinase [bacterium]|nr:serine/threonine protein kinase [bacterium]
MSDAEDPRNDSSAPDEGAAGDSESDVGQLPTIDLAPDHVPSGTVSDAPPAASPLQIGDYRIVGKLGEGGGGVVYEAEQQNPRRRVALKVIRGGLLVDETRLRLFQREIDTLARLKHPNIGAIYESGCTSDGQQFFAMELVQGPTLDEFLDRSTGTIDRAERRRRLLLLSKIADAVHHAHQRGVIHCDLKPSNVIVTGAVEGYAEGRAVPGVKILDFGLARMTGQDPDNPTLQTEVGIIRGTLPYMSPEQTKGDPSEIDVRTDVYALGIMLYEMLTGKRPHQVESMDLIDAVQVIRNEPPPPLSQSWDGSRPDSDIETILAKTLEKSPDRRYGSAAALSVDIGRYLTSQPILARPPSASYQLRKLIARHKLPFAFAATLIVLILGFGMGMGVLYTRAVSAEEQAVEQANTAERALEFVTDMFEMSSPSQARRTSITAREVLDHAAEQVDDELKREPKLQARLMATLGWVYRGLGHYEQAESLLTRATDQQREISGDDAPETLNTKNDLAVLYVDRGRLDEAERLHVEILEARRRVLGPEHPLTMRSMTNLAVVYGRQSRFDEEEALLQETIDLQRRVVGPYNAATLRTVNNLAVLYTNLGRYEDAEPLHRHALDGRRESLGSDHPETLNSMHNLAVLYDRQERYADAEPLYLETLELQRRVLGLNHPETLISSYNLGELYVRSGKHAQGVPFLLDALAGQRELLGESHPDTLDTMYNLACASALLGREQEALQFLGDALDLGYTLRGNPGAMLRDPDLSSLHDEPGFRPIEKRIRELISSN